MPFEEIAERIKEHIQHFEAGMSTAFEAHEHISAELAKADRDDLKLKHQATMDAETKVVA